MLRPITPFVEYAINYDYISKVLCINKDKPAMSCNGKCHLMKKIEKQQKDDYNALRISIEDYPIGFVKIISILNKKHYTNSKTAKFFNHKNYAYLFSESIFHPPTV